MVSTLRYLKRQFDLRGELDAVNVQHVVNVLKLVDEDLDGEAEQYQIARAG